MQMPILHWETDKKRHRFAKFIDDEIAKNNKERKVEETKETRLRMKEWNQPIPRQIEEGGYKRKKESDDNDEDEGNRKEPPRYIDTFGGAVMAYVGRYSARLCSPQVSRKGDRLMLKHPLAQFFYDASRLLEAMENYRDKKMLEKYLFSPLEPPLHPRQTLNHPLHPRRTLDQAYYCSLKNTKSRDRDQVVYRETTAKEDSWHSWTHVAPKDVQSKGQGSREPKTDCAVKKAQRESESQRSLAVSLLRADYRF